MQLENSKVEGEKKDALVWLVMKGNRYLKGACISAFSAKLTKTRCELVLMATKDVQIGDQPPKIFDRIVSIEYVHGNSKTPMSKRQKEKYGKWMDVSYTKWVCLSLIEYRKVIFVDADIIIHKNIDHLFQLDPPAGRFFNYMIKGKLNHLKHGDKINPVFMYDNLILTSHKKTRQPNFTVNGGFVLLQPEMKMFEKLLEISKQNIVFRNVSSIDECIISLLYTLHNKSWTNLDKIYNCETWKDKDYKNASVMHFIGDDLPWEIDEIKFKDLEIYKKYQNLYEKFITQTI